ncbi:MAG TPA: M28 family peptidase [Holophagaceae bacterium]|nr:M28 family peptidase [Holophagaceae bacterium]
MEKPMSRMLTPFLLGAALWGQSPALQVSESALRTHLAYLSDDLLEGRGTGQRGGDLAMAYLETQAKLMGLKPGNGASFRQEVRISGIALDTAGSALTFGDLKPTYSEDVVFGTGTSKALVAVDAPLVFVGYGITAPEEGWDDYKGLDCRGKVLVMMVNDPQPTAEQPNRFAGKSLTYYGRWTYKLEEAERHGAAGVLMIHTTPSASYGWSVVQSSWTHERFQLAHEGNPLQGWMTDGFAHKLFAAAGKDLDQLRAAAERKDFQPVELGLKVAGTVKSLQREVVQANIAAVVPGTDPNLKEEVVIYSAHWDHLGIDETLQKAGKDGIYNGSVDNASGSAALLAMAQLAVRKPAKRSQMFLWVCAEEQGLIGSSAYAAKPLWALAKTAADLNLDSLNFVGATKDIGIQGSERTSLGATALTVLKGMGLKAKEVEPDTAGGYFRSDHFCFAKVGVPAFSIEGGKDYVKEPAASKQKAEAYQARYHQVTDAYDPSWDLSGMAQQTFFTWKLGQAVANAPAMPAWKAGDPFGRARSK